MKREPKSPRPKTLNARELRAIMETLGMSGIELSARAKVDERSSRRWLSPNEPWDIPQGVIDEVITPEIKRQDSAVEAAIEIVELYAEEHGDPSVIKLPFYLSTNEVKHYHPGDTRTKDMANADSIRLRSALLSLGYNVELVEPTETGLPIIGIE